MLAVDPRRFGAYTSKRYVVKKNEETYRNVFTIHFPDEERAGRRAPPRPARCTTSSTRMGAVWGQRYGWERANWFAPPGVEAARTAGASGAATTSSTSATRCA